MGGGVINNSKEEREVIVARYGVSHMKRGMQNGKCGGVPFPGGAQGMTALMGICHSLDLMILKVFPSLNGSVILHKSNPSLPQILPNVESLFPH